MSRGAGAFTPIVMACEGGHDSKESWTRLCYGDRNWRRVMNLRDGAIAIAFALTALPHLAAADNVITYHNASDRHGVYTMPGLTLAAAATMHEDGSFHASVPGHVYAQPLFWHPAGGRALVIVATESNAVTALDAATGSTVWTTQ